MLPPPAPISIMSIAGTLRISPLPFLKRCSRATSISVVRDGLPPLMRQSLAVVPPMSNDNRFPVSDGLPVVGCGHRPSRRTGLDESHGERTCRLRCSYTALGEHHVDDAPESQKISTRSPSPRDASAEVDPRRRWRPLWRSGDTPAPRGRPPTTATHHIGDTDSSSIPGSYAREKGSGKSA